MIGRNLERWRLLGWGAAALLLLLPLLAGAPWTAFDFAVAGGLLGGGGIAFELAARRGDAAYTGAAGLALLTTVLLVWINGAVGMIGAEDDPVNLLFGGVLALALLGAVLARFESAGMARAMAAAAVAQMLVGAFGLSVSVRDGLLSMAFAGLWLLAAALFRAAAPSRA